MNEMKKIFLLSNTEQLNTGPEPTPHYHPSFTLFRHASQITRCICGIIEWNSSMYFVQKKTSLQSVLYKA